MPGLKISRRKLVAGAAGSGILSLHAAKGASDDPEAGFPAPITEIPFGAVSHWLQPWRELCRTRSRDEITDGIGVVIGGYTASQQALDMLRNQGFRHARIELGWGLVAPGTEAKLVNQAVITGYLARLRKAGLRPLILLNAYDGNPCPSTTFDVQLLADAPLGARSLTLASTKGLVPGRSGFRHLVIPTAGSILVTEIEGQRVSLSKPLPVEIPGGTTLAFVTLSYEPFSQTGTKRNERTMLGWLAYVDLVCRIACLALAEPGKAESGFDLEIWNELSFGSRFLFINNYYEPKLLDYNPGPLGPQIVQRSAAVAAAYPGVRISNGFANTIPWIAGSLQPPEITAISKHPYPPDLIFPAAQKPQAVGLDIFGAKTDFVPAYEAYFPEYYAHVIQTESLCRDLSDQVNKIGADEHGRLSRKLDGRVSPVDIWITEIGCDPKRFGNGEPAQAERQMTVFVLRSLFFHLGIGVKRVYLFEAFGAAGSYGLVDQASESQPSPVLQAMARLLGAIKGSANAGPPGPPMPITLKAYRRANDPLIFQGGGTPNLPALTTADSLVTLAVQVSTRRIAIIYYVMTRDIRVALAPQNFRVSIQAEGIQNFTATRYDPLSDAHANAAQRSSTKNQIELNLQATDAPQLLIFMQTS